MAGPGLDEEPFYGQDLAHIHHVGFGEFAARAAPALLRCLQDAGISDGLVVDLGCGSGIWARALLDAGYGVHGIDCSAAMIQLARSTASEGTFVQASLHGAPIPPCSAVTAIGEPLCYLNSEEAAAPAPLSSLFSRITEALLPGGYFIFDVVLRSNDTPMAYEIEHDGGAWRTTVTVAEDVAHARLTRHITAVRIVTGQERTNQESHLLRTFDQGDVEHALLHAGFSCEVSRNYGRMELPAQRLAFYARKPLQD